MLQNPWNGASFLFSSAEIYEWRLRAASDATAFDGERARGLSRGSSEIICERLASPQHFARNRNVGSHKFSDVMVGFNGAASRTAHTSR